MSEHIHDCECLPFNHAEEEKKAMINEVIKETNADQRLVMYKADLIRKIENMKDEWDETFGSKLDEVIQIIKKQ